jgi:molybdopterin synthase catalytic subunit
MRDPVTARFHTALTDQPLRVGDAYDFVTDPGAGAVVLFSGTVRDHTEGRAVVALDYEAYAERAAPQLEGLAADLAARWPQVRSVWIEHRVGSLAVGEAAVVVAVAAEHRAAAFAAAKYGIDTLKETVAIWKRERGADGQDRWVGSA